MQIEFTVNYLNETAQKLSVAVGKIRSWNWKTRDFLNVEPKEAKSNLFPPVRANTLNFQFNVEKLSPANGKKFIWNFM